MCRITCKLKKSDFNILLFLAIFIFLQEGFYLYVGLTTPGGKLAISFLGRYLNFPYWLTVSVTKSSKFVLEICGYRVQQADPSNIGIAGSRGVTIAWGCLGIGAMSLWLAFIVAHRYLLLSIKLKWIFTGLALIFMINIIRITMIALSNHYNWHYVRAFNAHNSFNMLTYLAIVIMMAVFVKKYKKSSSDLLNT